MKCYSFVFTKILMKLSSFRIGNKQYDILPEIKNHFNVLYFRGVTRLPLLQL